MYHKRNYHKSLRKIFVKADSFSFHSAMFPIHLASKINWLALSGLIAILLLYIWTNFQLDYFQFSSIGINVYKRFEKTKKYEDPFVCRLSDKNPWDAEIESFFEPRNPGPYPYCKPTFKEITQLGKFPDPQYLSLRPEFVQKVKSCKYRCLGIQLHEYDKWSEWTGNVQPSCDIFEVQCDYKNSSAIYHNIYYQIYRKPEDKTSRKSGDNQGFGVHIIVLDTVSRSHFFRALPKTSYLLREEFEAISFKFLNKVGDNSQPNGWAFLLGKQIADILPSPLNDHVIPADTNQSVICDGYIDNQTSFCGSSLQKGWLQDYAFRGLAAGHIRVGTLQRIQEATVRPLHEVKPFQMRMEQTFVPPRDPSKIYMKYHKNRCREAHMHLLEYFRQFVEQYEHVKTKYSLTWVTDLIHENVNHLYHADAHFFEYMRKLKLKLDNSFLFMMADHGSRGDKFVETHIGAEETSNPAFFLVLPKQLRNNQRLKTILETNSQELISHHDVYATLIEIAKKSHLWSLEDWLVDWAPDTNNEDWPLMHGSSVLHTLKQPRTCDSLRIPFEYCLCKLNYTKISANSDPHSTQLVSELAEAGVSRLNEELSRFNLTNICALLKLSSDSTSIVERLEHKLKDSNNTFKITFETLPGNGRFSGFLKADLNSHNTSLSKVVKSVKFISNTISRLNKHGDQSKCAKHYPTVQPYCYCK